MPFVPEANLYYLRVDDRAVQARPMLRLTAADPLAPITAIKPSLWKMELKAEDVSVSPPQSVKSLGLTGFHESLQMLSLSKDNQMPEGGLPLLNDNAEVVGVMVAFQMGKHNKRAAIPASLIAKLAPNTKPLPTATFVAVPQAEAASGVPTEAAAAPLPKVAVVKDPQERLKIMAQIIEKRKPLVAQFLEVQQEGADYEREIFSETKKYQLLSAQAAMYKQRGENVRAEGAFQQANADVDPSTVARNLATLQRRFDELKALYEQCLREGQKIEQNVASLRAKLAVAVAKRDELQNQAEQLRVEWFAQVDPHFQFPPENHEAALDTYTQWIAQDDQFAGAYLARGYALLHLGQLEMAAEDFEQAAKKDPGGASIALAVLGNTYSLQGKEKEAQAEFALAMNKNRKEPLAYLYKAVHLNRLGKYRLAMEEMKAAVNLGENDPECHRQMAWLLATCTDDDIRHGDRAVESAAKAQSLITGTPHWRMLLTLAAAHAEAGDEASTARYTEQLKAALPESPPAELTEQLASLEKSEPLRVK